MKLGILIAFILFLSVPMLIAQATNAASSGEQEKLMSPKDVTSQSQVPDLMRLNEDRVERRLDDLERALMDISRRVERIDDKMDGLERDFRDVERRLRR